MALLLMTTVSFAQSTNKEILKDYQDFIASADQNSYFVKTLRTDPKAYLLGLELFASNGKTKESQVDDFFSFLKFMRQSDYKAYQVMTSNVDKYALTFLQFSQDVKEETQTPSSRNAKLKGINVQYTIHNGKTVMNGTVSTAEYDRNRLVNAMRLELSSVRVRTLIMNDVISQDLERKSSLSLAEQRFIEDHLKTLKKYNLMRDRYGVLIKK